MLSSCSAGGALGATADGRLTERDVERHVGVVGVWVHHLLDTPVLLLTLIAGSGQQYE